MTLSPSRTIQTQTRATAVAGEATSLLDEDVVNATMMNIRSTVTSKDVTVVEDIVDTCKLGIPIFWSMLSWVGMKTTDTALLGHVSSQALAASALSDLWTMCTVVFIQGRILSVLCGAAVGAGNPKLAGVYLQVSYVVLAGLAIPVCAAWFATGQVWKVLGSQQEDVANMAGLYARILAISIPGQLAFSQLSQFFQAQRIMHPEVNASVAALVLNLVLGLVLVLGVPIPNFYGFGFVACPSVTTAVVYIQFFVFYFVYVQIQKLHLPCWGGWDRKEITWKRIQIFSDMVCLDCIGLHFYVLCDGPFSYKNHYHATNDDCISLLLPLLQYFPAAFGMASDFWRVAVVGAIAADLGETQVAVFNTSYRIMWIVMILVISLSSAAGIKMSNRLGNMDPDGAKQAGEVGIILSLVVLTIIMVGVFYNIRLFGRIFTSDKEFLDLFETTRLPFCGTLFLMNMSVAIERVPFSMGRTKEVFWMGLMASWGGMFKLV